ncbi:hypothetical protein COY25_02350, partial [Candidatus Uhrbacteria bacterium CG_4_10_14_0_2_um_filter_41_7]
MKENIALKTFVGWAVMLVLIFIPVIIWLVIAPISFRFSSVLLGLRSLSQIMALLGMSLMSVSLILSARLKLLGPWLGGLNKMYTVHHIVGGFAFIALLFHPAFSALTLISFSAVEVIKFLLPTTDPAILTGQLSLFILTALLFVTLYVKLPYEWWRRTHTFLGIPLLFAGAHVILINSDVSNSLVLKVYLLALAFVGVILYTYRTVFGRWLVRKSKYTITEVNQLSDRVVDLIMEPAKDALMFTPGQYAFLSFPKVTGHFETHPFSFSGVPQKNGELRFTIKSLGNFTGSLTSFEVGTEVLVEGPFGVFTSAIRKTDKQVWIGGGVGITPFLSMASDLNDCSSTDLIYACKNATEVVREEELR